MICDERSKSRVGTGLKEPRDTKGVKTVALNV